MPNDKFLISENLPSSPRNNDLNDMEFDDGDEMAGDWIVVEPKLPSILESKKEDPNNIKSINRES